MSTSLTTSMTEDQHLIQGMAQRFSRERLASPRGSGTGGFTAE